MAEIKINNLTFRYDNNDENIFENAKFSFDSSWKLGLIGRNGKGKTTLANLLIGKLDHNGAIFSPGIKFDYFPYDVQEGNSTKITSDIIGSWKGEAEDWRIIKELNKLNLDSDILKREYMSLSQGEQTKVMLATLFSGENEFLIIDEPTNHLDYEARETIKEYLKQKKSFILISHDRDLLDETVDHVLVLNRKTIEVQTGNFSTWWENKQSRDAYELKENENHIKEIAQLKKSRERLSRWAQKNENSKIGFDPRKEHDRNVGTRSYIASKTKKMNSKVRSYEARIEREIAEKEALLKDVETVKELKLYPKAYQKEILLNARDYSFKYKDSDRVLFKGLNFELRRGERIFLSGENGCGKSTFIRQIFVANGMAEPLNNDCVISGELKVGSGLEISYISQDTRWLRGTIEEYCKAQKCDVSLMLSLLRQLGFERNQFTREMENFSEGQKKKILIAGSLLNSAHLYIWDEPMNYVDVYSRMQIEELVLTYVPTMLIVDHDVRFMEKIATRVVKLGT